MKPAQLPTRAEDMFCHAIYTASHVINRAYAPFLKDLGVTYPQYITLTLLWERDGQTTSDLARQLEMQSNTMTPLLKRLEGLGFLRRVRGKLDERQVLIHLTDAGRGLQARAPQITACMVEGTSLTRAELAQLQTLLGKLRDGLGGSD